MTLAATTGATTRELMAQMGHSSPRAALIYQHAAVDRDRAVAEAMSALEPSKPAEQISRRQPKQPAPTTGQLALELD